MDALLELGAAGALFAAALVVGVVLAWLWPRGLQQLLEVLGRGFGVIDKALVTYVTWLFGLHWVTGRFARIGRWSLLIAMFVALACAGAFAPLPYALAALLMGVVGVVAAVRRWGWDEEDRANEVPKHLRRLQGDEDLVHEAMFAIGCMFLIAPLLFYRLDHSFHLFEVPAGLEPWAYAAYTLGEFLKAAPLLDYSEVYSVQNISGVSATGLGGRHATFVFRMLMDLALIAAVLQLLSVMERVASGRDLRRLQDMLDGGDADAAKSAIARLGQLGMRNQINAQRALVAVLETIGPDMRPRYPPEFRGIAANALRSIGDTLADTPLLLTAVDGYRALLRDWTREGNPEQWAKTQNNLGIALKNLGKRGDADALRDAVAAFRLALAIRTRDAAPTQWAMTQSNLGNALRILGSRGDADALRDAIAAHRLALEVYTRTDAPTDWAAVQDHLGKALAALGERGDADALRDAIEAHRLALEVYTRKDTPADWAMAQNNLGNALAALGERGDAGALKDAVAAHRAALEVYTRADAPTDWARTQNNLGIALAALGERGEAGALKDAVAAYRRALEIRTRKDARTDWAATQHNLATALAVLGARGDDQALRQAIATYRLALEVYTRDNSPANWATAQNNLGNALAIQGERTSDKADWSAAAECYRAALEVWSPESYPVYHEMASRSLARVMGKLGEH